MDWPDPEDCGAVWHRPETGDHRCTLPHKHNTPIHECKCGYTTQDEPPF